jgi:hypothetical protein
VCDFGFSISSESPARLDTCAGTEEFMAPGMLLCACPKARLFSAPLLPLRAEMENGDEFALPADVFSAGIMLCELATKRK